MIFQNSEYAPNHVALIPTQLYSSGLDFLHFLLLLLIARNKKEDGQVTACYLIFYRDCGDRAADTDQEKKR